MITTPQNLRTNGELRPLGVGRPPRLTWDEVVGQSQLELIVQDSRGEQVWASGRRLLEAPEAQPDLLLSSRGKYRWKVRVATADGPWSAWSDYADWESPLLDVDDWEALWIGRPVSADTRIVRSIDRGWIDWASPGETLAQSFEATGVVTAVNVDLVGPRDVPISFDLDLIDSAGVVTHHRTVEGPQNIWERFLHFVELDPPAPPGRYEMRLSVREGTLGWHTGHPSPKAEDDGVSPLPVLGHACRDGRTVAGVRSIGVETIPAPNPVFRTHLTVVDPVTRARLHGVILGNGRIFINGHPIDEALLDPPPTDFDKTILYRTWDATELLHQGDNEIVIEAGRGTFAARGASVWGWHLAPWHKEPIALLQLEWSDGSGTHVVGTGPDWETAAGDVVQDIFYSGETSVTPPDRRHWQPAKVVAGIAGRLTPTTMPPIRVTNTLLPIGRQCLSESLSVYDFGITSTGFVRLRARGTAGARFTVRSGEELDAAGRVRVVNQLAAGPSQTDLYLFEHDATIEWTQRHGYRGFRWVEIQLDGDIEIDGVEALRAHTDVGSAGEFDTDHPVLAWWDGAMRHTFLNNLHGIPTDTPIYEKNGWTADAHLATEALLQQVDLRDAFAKWVDDHVDAQSEDGAIPQIIPTPGWARPADPAWSASAVLIPWHLYWEYGDLAILQRAESMARRLSDHLLVIAESGTWTGRSWGDWLAPGYNIPPESGEPIATAMMVSVIQHTAAILRALGKSEACLEYEEAAKRVAETYHRHYFDPTSVSYGIPGVGYRQTMNVLPLALGIVPAMEILGVGRSLVGDIERRTEGHLDTGAIGSRHLLHVLDGIGRADLALTVATTRTRPGWGAWFEAGESTLMESWDADARSRNHYFLGAALSWVHQRVGGLRASSPGWRTFVVDPIDDPRIARGQLAHRTILGTVSVAWRRGGDDRVVHLRVPNGARATVPAAGGQVFEAGSHVITVPNSPVSGRAVSSQ